MLKLFRIKLRYWHLIALIIWLSFKFQFSAASPGCVIQEVEYLNKDKLHTRQNTNAQIQSKCRTYSIFNFGPIRRWLVNTIPRPLYHGERERLFLRAGPNGYVKYQPLRFDALTMHLTATHSTRLINFIKSKFHSQTILTAVHCTSNYVFFALCTSYSV